MDDARKEKSSTKEKSSCKEEVSKAEKELREWLTGHR
jgi:hypothetical protein